MIRLGGVLLIVIAAGAGCGGSSNLPFCPTPPLPAFALVNPSPGATNVPDNLSSLTFQGSGPSQIMLTGGTQDLTLTLTQNVAPISTPLLASTTYTVEYSYTTSGSDCTPQSFTVEPGSFTTR